MSKNVLFSNFPSSQSNVGNSRQNLNDLITVGSTIIIDDIKCISDGDDYELNNDEVEDFKKSGKLPKGVYMIFSVNVSTNGKVETRNVAPYTLFNMDVANGDDKIKLGKYLSHTKDGIYNEDDEKAKAIDFSKLNEMEIKGLDPVFETRPSVTTFREDSNMFKNEVHYIKDADNVGSFKHFKYASKDHEGFGQMFREASTSGTDVDYTKVAKQPVNSGAKPLQAALVHVNYQA